MVKGWVEETATARLNSEDLIKVSAFWLSRTCGDNKILSIVGWVSRGDDFEKKQITFHPRRNPPPESL